MLPFYLVRAENKPAARCHKWRVIVRFPADASGKRRTRSCTVEGSRRVAKAKGTEGSSPRMRGARLGILGGANEDGIIPAHAGSTR